MKHTPKLIDLDKIADFKRFEVKVNGKMLPIAIGDKIQFPTDDPYLKTVVGIQINENGIENYLIEWFEDGIFKQNSLTLTELKVLRDNCEQRAVVQMIKDEQEKKQAAAEAKSEKHSKKI